MFGKRLQFQRVVGKVFGNVFVESLEKFLETMLEHFWKFGFLLETCVGNVLGSPGKLFVEKCLFSFERFLFWQVFGNMNIWKIVGTILERFNPLCGERPINNNRRMFLNIRLRQLTNGTIVKTKKHAMNTTKYNKCNWTFWILLENNSCFKICFVFVHKRSLHFRCGWRLLLIANKSFE